MWKLNEVKNIRYVEDWVLHVVFDDGVEGNVDLSEYVGLGPVFEPLRDKQYFASATVANGTVSWANGADIAPETLYEKLESAHKMLEKTA
ncbi:TPA: DUF2442 domain-containing protein [Candidatus Sumerlaeota bacterium]|jgi:hypothetical protein|nr:DUF2442 domain-containing protein [Candidatus Sumerlaeota bacterium]